MTEPRTQTHDWWHNFRLGRGNICGALPAIQALAWGGGVLGGIRESEDDNLVFSVVLRTGRMPISSTIPLIRRYVSRDVALFARRARWRLFEPIGLIADDDGYNRWRRWLAMFPKAESLDHCSLSPLLATLSKFSTDIILDHISSPMTSVFRR